MRGAANPWPTVEVAPEGAAGLTLLGYVVVLAITPSFIALNLWALVRLATEPVPPA